MIQNLKWLGSMESKSKDSEICLTEISDDNPGNDEEGVFKKAKLIIIQN